MFIGAFAFIYVTNRSKGDEAAIGVSMIRPFGLAVAAVGIFVLYNSFRIEITNYFHIQAVNAALVDNGHGIVRAGYDFARFNIIWQLNYTMFFLSALAMINLRKTRSTIMAFVGFALSVLTLFAFTTVGMFLFYELREGYMLHVSSELIFVGPMHIAIRYISYAFAGALLWSLFACSRNKLLTDFVPANFLLFGYEAIFNTTVLIAASCELTNLMAHFHIPDGERLGLSILWGIYALVLIGLGIAWNKKTFADRRYCFAGRNSRQAIHLRRRRSADDCQNDPVCIARHTLVSCFVSVQ